MAATAETEKGAIPLTGALFEQSAHHILYYGVVSQAKPPPKKPAEQTATHTTLTTHTNNNHHYITKEEPEVTEEVEETEMETEEAETEEAVEVETETEENLEKPREHKSDPYNVVLYYHAITSFNKPSTDSKQQQQQPKEKKQQQQKKEKIEKKTEETVGKKVEKKDVLIPTMFEWKHGGTEVFLTGSFNNWTDKISLDVQGEGVFSKSGKSENHLSFCVIHLLELSPLRWFIPFCFPFPLHLPLRLSPVSVELPVGDFDFKFVVDGEWKHNPDLPSTTDDKGNTNNTVHIEVDRGQLLLKRQNVVLATLEELEKRLDTIASQV